MSWQLLYPAPPHCVVEPPQLSPTAAPLTTSQIRCLDNNSSPLLPHEIPKPSPHLPCLNHWLQSAPVCQSVPVTACFSMPGCVTGCLAALLSGCPSFCFYCLRWCLLSSVLLLPLTPLLSNCIPCFAAVAVHPVPAATVCGACRARSELAAVECAVQAVAVGGSSPTESCAVRCPGFSSS